LVITTDSIVQCAKTLIKTYNGEIPYYYVGEILCGRGVTGNEQAGGLLALSVICHNIPYYENNQRLIRNLDECLRDAITFYNSNKAEGEVVSRSAEKEWNDIMTGFTLPRLYFGDNSHYVFKSGSGKSRPDLSDDRGLTYEVKRNFRDGSRASLHKADYLIDCKNTTIEIRKINKDGSVDLEYYPIARVNGFLSEKQSIILYNISPSTAEKLTSGELITEVERALQEKGFAWNP
jgi:hypothetical protein